MEGFKVPEWISRVGKEPSGVKPSPVPALARRQAESLDAMLEHLQAEAVEARRRDKVQLRLAIITLAVAIATLIAAIVALIH